MNSSSPVVAITGGGKGIGKAAALRFAKEGFAVAVCSRTLTEVEATAEEVEKGGGSALAARVDISREDEVEKFIERIVSQFGRIDVLVNNAAVVGGPGRYTIPLWEMPTEDWDLVYGVNIRGAMLCAKHVLRHMTARHSGSIINVSSEVIRREMKGRTHYASSKMALIGLTSSLAWDAGAYGIRANCIIPGLIHTELVEAMFHRFARERGKSYDQIVTEMSANSPEGRPVQPEEVAETMVYLGTDRSRGVNGQSFFVNAGAAGW